METFFNTLHCFCFQCIFLIATTQLTIADFSSCIPEGKKLLYICLFVQSKKAMVFLLLLKYYRISKNIVIYNEELFTCMNKAEVYRRPAAKTKNLRACKNRDLVV